MADLSDIRCVWCGAAFVRPHSRGPIPKFCSAAHRQAAFRRRHDGDNRSKESLRVRHGIEQLPMMEGDDGVLYVRVSDVLQVISTNEEG